MVTIINLFPHRQVIVRPQVKFKRYTLDLVEHNVQTDIVGQVRQRPLPVIVKHRQEVKEKFDKYDDDKVDDPRTLKVDPVCIEVGVQLLVNLGFMGVRFQMLYNQGRPSLARGAAGGMV